MDNRKKLLKRIDSLRDEIFEVSAYIHKRPEKGYEEFKAAEILTSKLRAHDFKVETPLKKYPTALRASYRGKARGPSIGFISEFDALPGIGHGCGHNLIAASGFGTVVALAPFLDELGGSVYLYGTPAEEYDGGKIPMLEAGLFDPVDLTLMMHPESFYMVNVTALALDALRIRFRGKASHAAATPYEGINALDAMILLFNGINALRQQLKTDARIHGIITKGGTYPNIIPDITEAEIYVRASERSYLNEVTAKVTNCAKGAAKATGCRLKISPFERSMDNMINNPVLMSLVAENLRTLGIEKLKAEDDVPGSTDYGNVSHRVPSMYFYIASAPEGSPLHTRDFTKLSITAEAHEALIISIKAMALTALDLFTSPKIVEDVRAAFAGRKSDRRQS